MERSKVVLEERLRKLCEKHRLTLPAKPTIVHLKLALRKATIINKIEETQVDWLAGSETPLRTTTKNAIPKTCRGSIRES